MSLYPCASKSATAGDTSAWPENHGFTVCLSVDTTSIRCSGISERTWALNNSSLREIVDGCDTAKKARLAPIAVLLMPVNAAWQKGQGCQSLNFRRWTGVNPTAG